MASDVRAGENNGRKLSHDFVVLGTTKVPAKKVNDMFEAELTSDFKLAGSSKRLALAVWVSEGKALQPVQAVGGWLPEK